MQPLSPPIRSRCRRGYIVGWIGAWVVLAGMSRVADGQAAVGGPVVPAVSATRVDGFEVLAYPSDALRRAPQFTVSPRPIAVAGGTTVNPAFDLTRFTNALLLRDGRIVSYSMIGAKLLVFRPDGRADRVIGRMGQGPGEFMAAVNVAPAGDSLLLVDRGNNRINWIVPERGVVAEQPLPPKFDSRLQSTIGALPGGRIVMSGAGVVQSGSRNRVTRPLISVGVLASHDGATKEIAAVPDLAIAMVETHYGGRGRVGPYAVRLGPAAHVVVWDTLVAIGSGERYEIAVRDGQGRPVRRLSLPVQRRPVTRSMRTIVVDRELAAMRGPRREGLLDPTESERMASDGPFADSLPAYSALFVSADNLLWVVDALAPGDTAWSATGFRLDGAIVARVRGQGTAIPVAFGPNRVVLRREDGDGVVSLAVHQIVRDGR